VDLLIVAEPPPRGRMPCVQQFLPVEEAPSARCPSFRSLRLSPVFKMDMSLLVARMDEIMEP
jgi:hypothetical protein